MEHIFAELISTATIAIAAFGIAGCFMQRKHLTVTRSFAAFLAAVVVNNIPEALNRAFQNMQVEIAPPVDVLLWLPSALCLAPLFWIYVYRVTSTDGRGPKHMYRHLALPYVAFVAGTVALVSPASLWTEIMPDDSLAAFGWWTVLLVVVALLQLAVYPQMAIYLFLIVRRLTRYRLMLRDIYASTEQHELRWIYVIGVTGALYWLVQALVLLMAFDPDQSRVPLAFVVLGGLASLCLVATTVLWGLRQTPPLMPESEVVSMHSPPNEPTGDKYEKSALSEEASARIARKLRNAMEVDNLHRDPNLSLWALARHIGASPNYISQTLNEAMGENFFDFVNGYRIADAMTRLSTTDETVLAITYDVGFNARSSFYNAFKRVTGQTPTGYRKTLSLRDGMDDLEPELREV